MDIFLKFVAGILSFAAALFWLRVYLRERRTVPPSEHYRQAAFVSGITFALIGTAAIVRGIVLLG